jgi:MFS family permease
MVVFEIGSIICATAPTSTAFIVGRALAGIGSAGIGTGGIIIFVDLLPLQKRPKYQGSIGASFGIAAIVGPLLGGVFTSKATWRWCFWINVPIGALAVMVLFLILPSNPPPKKHGGESFKQRLMQFDPVGTAFLLPGLVLVLLALQWGSNQYAWSSTRVIVSLVLGLVLLIAFAICQLWAGDNGTIPPRILGQQSVASTAGVSFGLGSALLILTFYLPIWYQAIKGLSAEAAGVRLLPYFLGTVIFVIGSGILVSKIGYYTPVLNVGTALVIVGCGLFTTFQVDTSTAKSLGFQVSN